MRGCTILQSGTCRLNSSEKRLKDEFKWLLWSLKKSWKYDAEVLSRHKLTATEAMKCFCCLSQVSLYEVREINSARQQGTFILKCTVKVIKNRPAL